MPKLTYKCPICQKDLILKAESLWGQTRVYEYKCGHFFNEDQEVIQTADLNFTAKDNSGKKARHYQESGVKFIVESNFNCIIGDQMRLGKTPQGLLALANRYEERTPCLIIVKGANLWQWTREYKTWADTLPNGIYPIIGSKAWIPPGFSSYIISMDTFSKPSVQEVLKLIPFKLIIVDEAHSFKNTESNRSQALVDFVRCMNTGESDYEVKVECPKCHREHKEKGRQKFDKRIGMQVIYVHTRCECGWYINQSAGGHEKEPTPENRPCGIILLTGTPILNRAEEYFVPLNLVSPEKFSSLERFRHTWLSQNNKGQWNRVKSTHLEAFKETIKPVFLRREKEDVYTDLPKLNKIFTLIEPDKNKLADQYNKVLDRLEMNWAKDQTYFGNIKELTILRGLCGLMKLPWTVDYLESCQEDTAAKYAIGIHHEQVRDLLYTRMGADHNCFKLSGQDNADRKDWIMRHWEESNKQFLIINMLAGGVGMDFHYCDNVLILERQWNSEIEGQFEFRFYNPDLSIKKNPTNIEYVIAKGTIDEFFYDMIEGKRRDVGETVYNHFNLETDVDSLKMLIERTLGARL